MSILAIIADNSTAILALCVPGLLASGGYLVWKLLLVPADTPSKPVGAVARGGSSLEVGQAKHQARAEAKTIKFASPVPDRDERQIDTAKVQADADNSPQKRAEKMEKLGFHSPARQVTPSEADASKIAHIDRSRQAAIDNAAAETLTTDLTRSDLLPTVQGDQEQTSALAAPAQRVQTQDLDDILSRIDKVLSENPVLATTTLSPGAVQAPLQPVTEITPKPQG